MPYVNVFSGSPIAPSEIRYRAVSLTADTTLLWPLEANSADNLLAGIMDVTPSTSGLSLTMPDARAGSTGNTTLFTNLGVDSFEVLDADGVLIVTVAPGEAWTVFLRSNTTEAGTWGTFEFGAYISQTNIAAIAGNGLRAGSGTLSTAIPVSEFNTNVVLAAANRAELYVWTGTTGNITLPDPAVTGELWYVMVKNLGTGTLTVLPGGSAMVDGEASKSLEIGDSAIFATNGTDFFSVGFGQSVEFAFDTVSINVAGTGDYTLTGSELNRISYNFTGLLTGNRNIIVPATIQQYWIRNNTTGSFTLTVKVSGQTGTGVTQGGANILFCDGIDVRSANTGGIATPIAVADGGTGATTPSAARTNLGAGATGDVIFTATTANQVWSALGAAPSGTVDGGTF